MEEDRKVEIKSEIKEEEEKKQVTYFQCEICELREQYEYFGNEPPFVKRFKFKENVYIIQDPFVPPKQGEYIVLGAHCIKCGKCVCKDTNCSLYFSGTWCIYCAKNECKSFPANVQEKINKIVIS